MDFEALRCVQHLSRTLHFGETSRECHKSPPALTRIVQRVEEELGANLFVRTHRRVELTEAGRRVAAFAGEILSRYDALAAELRERGPELEGRLRIFTTVTASFTLLPDALERFRRVHPRVRIELETGDPVDALPRVERGRIDVAVASVPDRLPKAMVGRTLLRTPLLMVAPTAPGEVAERTRARRLRWAELPMILPRTGATRDHVDRWFRRRTIRPTLYSEVAGSEAILSLVALGCGVGVVPKLVYERSPLRNRVRVLDIEAPIADLRVAACAARARLRQPVIRAFWRRLEVGTP